MNQILSIGGEPQKKENEVKNEVKAEKIIKNEAINRANATSNKADILKIIKIFVFSIILFGLVLVGESTYAIIQNSGNKIVDNVEITADRMGKETKIVVTSEKYPIKEFSYKWNDGEPVKIEGNGTLTLETIIQIPNGNNILRMTVTDNFGNEKNFHKQYLYDSSDVSKPKIEIAITGVRLSIKASDDIAMETEENPKEINVNIDVPSGQNKLTIIAADKEGNRETRVENIIGDTKPTFTLSKDGKNIILKAQDDEGISKVSMTIDGVTKDSGNEPINKKEISVTWEVEKGTHTISFSIINVNGLESSGKVTAEI